MSDSTAHELVYCIYSDKKILKSESSPEHIIPLSLGGVNTFTVPVSRKLNSEFGHSIDGAFSNDPLITLRRAKKDSRGHNNSPVVAKWRRGSDDKGDPIQTIISKDKLSFFDAKSRRFLTDEESAGRAFKSQFKIEQFVRLPFSAKVALGVGYFLYEEAFLQHTYHGQLRALLKPFQSIEDTVLRNSRVLYFDRINDPDRWRDDLKHRVVERIIQVNDCSAVVVLVNGGSLTFVIGILGEWQATISVPADGVKFLGPDDPGLPQILLLKNGSHFKADLSEEIEKLPLDFRRVIASEAGAITNAQPSKGVTG